MGKPRSLPPRPWIGQCIYCGSTVLPLTKEHVLPKALGGKITLPGASCKLHQNATRDIEQSVTRDIFGPMRQLHGLRISEPHRHRPIYGNEAELVLPAFAPARLLSHWPWPERLGLFWDTFESDLRGLPFGPPGPKPRIDRLDFRAFTRFLAKVALGLAVTRTGIDGFVPWVRPAITDKESDPLTWVGGTPNRYVKLSGQATHSFVGFDHFVDGRTLLIVQLQLFAPLGTPVYSVVVGEFTLAGLDKHAGTNEFFST